MQHLAVICIFLALGCSWGIPAEAPPCLLEKPGDFYVIGMFEVCTYIYNLEIDQYMNAIVNALAFTLNHIQSDFSGFTLGYMLFTSCGDCLSNVYNCYLDGNCLLYDIPVILYVTQDSLDYLFEFGSGTTKVVINERILPSFLPNLVTFSQVVESFFVQNKWNLVGAAYESCNDFAEYGNQNSSNYCNDWKILFNNFQGNINEIKQSIRKNKDNATLYFGDLMDFKELISGTGDIQKPFVYCCLETLEDLADVSKSLNGTILIYKDIRVDDGFYSYFKEAFRNLSIFISSSQVNVTVTCQNDTSDNIKYHLKIPVAMRYVYSFIRILYKTVNNTCLGKMSECQNSTTKFQSFTQNETSLLQNYIKIATENVYDFKIYRAVTNKTDVDLTCYNISQTEKLHLCATSCNVSQKMTMVGTCCMHCEDCPEGTFSNGTTCLRDTIVHGVLICILSPIGILLCFGVFIVFLKYADTPIVKSSGGSIFYCYLTGLIIAFSSSFLFIGKPTDGVCMVGLPLSALGFALCLSSILSRSSHILLAFSHNSEKPTKFQRYFYIVIIVIGTLGELIICCLWMRLDPLHFQFLPYGQVFTNMGCKCTHLYWYFICFGYLALLCLASWTLAIKSHSLPPSFSESSSISFSMMIFLTIWSCVILIIVSKNEELQAVILGVSISVSSWGFLICISLPKVYIILFRPERNSQKWISFITLEYCHEVAFKADLKFEAQRSSISTSYGSLE
ncbi:G-protein coupled receptor family C group 6 member A-like [Polypterus senegalus]|uniref:G-protein coupled receptor family C group 6 member A-like n=1 Tax=Polypterus senegalus TaxID=55291 RepID=UPI0019624C4C|nr:G-protein coupled receptor family C group 6 member A-like [Polypterus senegalus]XP_039631911.1 G-protein coupled receptor family C group 6 member A-like [Polypterus senegalus]